MRRPTQLHPGASIVVLDAGALAEGAAGRNLGFMIDLSHELTNSDYAGSGDDRAQTAMNRKAIAVARDAVQDYEIASDFFDDLGKINGAVSEAAVAHTASYAAHLATLDELHEHLVAGAMEALTGSPYYASGFFYAGHGYAAACRRYSSHFQAVILRRSTL